MDNPTLPQAVQTPVGNLMIKSSLKVLMEALIKIIVIYEDYHKSPKVAQYEPDYIFFSTMLKDGKI